MNRVFDEASVLARRATLEVRASNAGARRLYERLGFTSRGLVVTTTPTRSKTPSSSGAMDEASPGGATVETRCAPAVQVV